MEPMIVNSEGAEFTPSSDGVPELQYRLLPLAKVQVRSTSEERKLSCQVKVSGKWYCRTCMFAARDDGHPMETPVAKVGCGCKTCSC